MRRVILRADGGTQIGLGHIHRILALAQMLDRCFKCVVAVQEPTPSIRQLFEYNYQLIALPYSSIKTESFYNELSTIIKKDDIVVLDGYHFDTEYQKRVKRKAYKLVSIDDIHAVHFISDLVINHSGGIHAHSYSVERYTKLLLGPRYCLIKKEFRNAAKRKTSGFPPNLLINCGGADPLNHTYTILERMLDLELKFNVINIVVGSAYSYRCELNGLISRSGFQRINMHDGCSTSEMLSLMEGSNVAILPPSTVLFEYCSIGGVVFLEQIAANQKEVFEYFTLEGLALPFKDIELYIRKLSTFDSTFFLMISAQQEVFDQKSGDRILTEFLNL